VRTSVRATGPAETEKEKVKTMQYTDTTETNVISATFENDDAAYGAFAELKQLDSEGVIDLHGASVLTREGDGRIVTVEATEQEPVGLATGGVMGLLVGVLAGPLGVMIGGTTGLLAGSLYDLDDADETESVLTALSSTVVPGRRTLLAELREPTDHAAVDKVIGSRPSAVLRRDLFEVEAEIAAAEQAQREASKEARKQLRDDQLLRNRTQVEARVAEMKAKLSHSKGTTAQQQEAPAEVASPA
jgi:uncharacterized membrane protein